MPYIIPNTTAVPQTVSAAQIVVNGTTCTWPSEKIVEGVKVIHHIECSIGCENTGAAPAELKITLQRDIGSGWEDVAGEVACYTIAAGDDARRKANFKVPYYTGISGFVPRYRLLAECPAGEATLHRAEGRDAVPTVTGKQEHEFEGEPPVITTVIFNAYTISPAPTAAYYDAIFANDMFIAVSHVYFNDVYTVSITKSTDTINMTRTAHAGVLTAGYTDIAHNPQTGRIVMSCNNSNFVAYSDDYGVSWTQIRIGEEYFPQQPVMNLLEYGNGKFVGMSSSISAAPQLWHSADGATWTSIALTSAATWSAMAFGNDGLGNDVFVAVPLYQNLVCVFNGTDAVVTSGLITIRQYRDMAFGDGKFVAIAYGNTFIMSSDNGESWVDITVPLSRDWSRISYFNSQWVVIANNGTADCVMTSADLVTWTVLDRPDMNGSMASVICGNDNGESIIFCSNLARAFVTFDQTQIPAVYNNTPIEVTFDLEEMKRFKLSVPAQYTQIQIDATVITGDAELYVARGYLASRDFYDYAAENAGSEQLIIENSTDSIYGISVYGYAAGSCTLQITLS